MWPHGKQGGLILGTHRDNPPSPRNRHDRLKPLAHNVRSDLQENVPSAFLGGEHVLASPKGERMAGSNMNQRGLVGLPRNWRVITVASLTMLGLASGADQTALGNWWSLPKAKPPATKATVAQPASTKNGFSSTIHRLMSDARLYAEKGELDKAVQLADRAAKISDASSQLLGPASEYSPEKTARFANELRARRDAVAKHTVPTPAAPTVAAAAPRPKPTTPRSQEVASSSPAPQPLERRVVEHALDERVVAEQPAKRTDELLDSKLAWAEELPPNPAPEAEPASKPIKFRRSVLARAAQSTGEEADESRSLAKETTSPSIADSAIDELLEAEFASELPIESPAVPGTADMHVKSSLNDPAPSQNTDSQTADSLPSLEGGIQPVAAETPANGRTPLPTAPAAQSGWEDEAFAEELLLGKSSAPESADARTKPATPATRNVAQPFPDDAFPVQRVVQLRRRLETAASLNPGGAYTLPARPSTEPTREASSLPSSNSVINISAPSSDSPLGDLKEEADDWMTAPDLNERPPQQTTIKPVAAQTERPVVRLREHRVLPDHVRAALLKAAALPPAPAARRQIVGYSQPMLWQSADEHDSGLPELSLANGIGGGTSGSHSASGASLPPDLRDLPPSTRHSDETPRAGQRVIPAISVEQTGFRSVELPADSIQLTDPSGPALSSSNGTSATNSALTDPAGSPLSDPRQSPDSNAHAARSTKHPTAASQKSHAPNSKASHEVAHQSFAVIEPLATALQLPIATTASLLGGAGLALLGLGLLLVRAAIRWRHS